MNAIKPVRYHSMDALRAIAMLLGIYMHTAIPMAAVEDVSQHPIPQIIQQFIHMFRMQTFFLVAGFFARFLYHRDGWVQMMTNRSKRILLPLILGCIFLLPLTHVMIVFGAVRAKDPNAAFPWQDIWNYFEAGRFWTYLFPNYLWFLIYLIFMYMAAVVGHKLIIMVSKNGRVEGIGDWLIQTGCTRWYGFIIWTLIGAVWMISTGSITVDLAPFYFMPLAGPFGLYFLFFVAGWLLHRNVELLDQLKKRWLFFLFAPIPVLIVGAIFCIPFFMNFTEVEMDYLTGFFAQFKGMKEVMASHDFFDDEGIARWFIVEFFHSITVPQPVPFNVKITAMMLTLFSVLMMWAWSFCMVGLFVRFFSTQSAWFRYIADSSYWLYLTHMPLVMYLQVEWAYWEFPWYLKLPLLNIYIIVILLISYHFLIRSTILGVILNGRRYPFHLWYQKTPPVQSP